MNLKIYVTAFCALAAFAASGGDATSAPVTLQYDEIARVVAGQATPPPAGAFKADLAAINNASSTQTAQAPPKKHGFGNLLGAVLSGENPLDAATGNLADNLASNALGGMLGSLSAFTAFMREGKLAHYTFYNGWERVDDAAARTAMITKYDRNQIIYLDLAKKTYRTVDPSAHASAPEAPKTSAKAPDAPKAPPEQPGTAVIDFSRVGTSLGSAQLDGVASSGFSSKVTMAMTQATGSCRNGSFSMTSAQYLASFQEPKLAYGTEPAPARPASRVPTDPRTMVSRGGCSPTFTVHNSGPTPPSERFIMYSLVSLDPQSAGNGKANDSPASTLAFVTERGNVQSLSAAAAAPLFEIPAGFVPAP